MKLTQASNLVTVLSSLTTVTVSGFRGSQISDVDMRNTNVDRKLEQTAQDYTCTGGQDYSIYFKGKCDYEHLVERMNLKVAENDRCVNSGAKEVQLLVGIIAGASDPTAVHEAKRKVEKLCKAAMDAVTDDPSKVRSSYVSSSIIVTFFTNIHDKILVIH